MSRPRHVSLLTQHHLPLFFTRRDPTRETSNTSSPDPTQPARGFENLLIRPPGRAMTREKRFFLKMAFFWRGWYNGSPQVRSLRKKLLDPSAVACVQTSWKPTVLHLSSSAFVPLADATRFFFVFCFFLLVLSLPPAPATPPRSCAIVASAGRRGTAGVSTTRQRTTKFSSRRIGQGPTP